MPIVVSTAKYWPAVTAERSRKCYKVSIAEHRSVSLFVACKLVDVRSYSSSKNLFIEHRYI